jgi:hypothetical protein
MWLAPALLLPAAALAEKGIADLSLLFTGSGSALKQQTLFVRKEIPGTRGHTLAAVDTLVRVPFSGSGLVEVTGLTARIKLPSGMLPLVRLGEDGWFTIDGFAIGPEQISGTVRINAQSKPKLSIDRASGAISLSDSLGQFSGTCERVDARPE